MDVLIKKRLENLRATLKHQVKKISEWVSELLVNHKEVVVDDYKAYCKEVIEQELDLFRNVFKSKNGLLDN